MALITPRAPGANGALTPAPGGATYVAATTPAYTPLASFTAAPPVESYVPHQAVVQPVPTYTYQPAAAMSPAPSVVVQPAPLPPGRLTEGIPDPAAIETQKRAYVQSLDAEVDQSKQLAADKVRQQKASIKLAAEQQLAMYKAQLDQAVKQHELGLDQQLQQRTMELQEALIQSKTLLEQQASSLELEYHQRKMQEEMLSKQAEMQREMHMLQAKMQQEVIQHQQKQMALEQQHHQAQQQQDQMHWDMMRTQQGAYITSAVAAPTALHYSPPAYTAPAPTTAVPTTYVLPPTAPATYVVQSAPYQAAVPEVQAHEALRGYTVPVATYAAQGTASATAYAVPAAATITPAGSVAYLQPAAAHG